MEPASPPPQPASNHRFRRFGPTILAGLSVVGFAAALVVSFVGGGSVDAADVVKLDRTATTMFNGIDTTADVIGSRIGSLSYTTFDGEVVPLETDGRPLLVNFWASTCTPCVKEMPALDAVTKANAGRIDVLGLDYYEPPDAGLEMIEKTGVTYPVGRDPRGSLLRTFGGTGLPFTVLISADGTVLTVHAGSLDEAGFQELIDTVAGR